MNRNIEERNSSENIEKIFAELVCESFIAELEQAYERKLTKENLLVEYLDLFGQAVVYLNFEDKFAVRDNAGVWRKAGATECVDLIGGDLLGMQILVS